MFRIDISLNRTITGGGHVKRNFDWTKRTHPFSPSQHLLFILTKGVRKVSYLDHWYHVNEGDFLFFFAGEKYYFPQTLSKYEAKNLHFSKIDSDIPLKSKQDHFSQIDQVILPFHLPMKNHTKIISLFQEVYPLIQSSHPLTQLKASALLQNLLIELTLLYQKVGHRPNLSEKIVQIIQSDLSKNYSIEELSGLIGVSPSTLKRNFKKHSHTSIQQFQKNAKMKQAIQLFNRDPKVLVQHVAEELGYYDPFHFSKVFKSFYGISPKTYQQRCW